MAIEQKRIEAAARALMSDWGTIDTPTEREREYAIEKVTFIISAAYPELASDPPTGWVAPMEVTEAMWIAGSETPHARRFVRLVEDADDAIVGAPVSASAHGGAMASQAYRAARDAHLKEQGHEWPEDR